MNANDTDLLAGSGQPTLNDDILRAWLREDAPFGDLTTESLPLHARAGWMQFCARDAMFVAGIEDAARLLELAGARVRRAADSGDAADAGGLLLEAEGPAPSLLLGWKVAQTLVEAASGIATATARIVAAVRHGGFAIPVACTRKNFPGTRAVAARAVRAGGGVMHRSGLSETLLVFPEHRAFLSPAELADALAGMRAAQPEKRLVVEVGSEEDAFAMAAAGADVLQLERFSPATLAALRAKLAAVGLTPRLAPAGGVNVANALDYACAGADFLVTSAPYFAPPADVKVRIGARVTP